MIIIIIYVPNVLSHSPLIASVRLDTFFLSTFTCSIILVFLSNQHAECKHFQWKRESCDGQARVCFGKRISNRSLDYSTHSLNYAQRQEELQPITALSASHALHICSVPGISSNHGSALFELCLVVQIACDCCIT